MVQEAGLSALKRQRDDRTAELCITDQDLVHGLQAVSAVGLAVGAAGLFVHRRLKCTDKVLLVRLSHVGLF